VKKPIAWHEVCLINMKNTLSRERITLDVHRLRIAELSDRVAFAERQIAEAKRRGMDEFDADRLLRKRASLEAPP
jgi:hypothetical protein